MKGELKIIFGISLLFVILLSVFVFASEEKIVGGEVGETESWFGNIICDVAGEEIEGEWNFEIANGIATGEFEISILHGSLEGVVKDHTIFANLTYEILGKSDTIEVSGEISEEMLSGDFEFDFLGKPAKCSWNGTREEKAYVHYGSIHRKINGGRIDLTYVPICAEKCTKIVFIQVVCPKVVFADGTSSYFEHQSDSSNTYSFMDADEVDGGKKCVVDYLQGENDPYYNGDDNEDHGAQGKHGISRNATMSDRPRFSESEFTNIEAKYGKQVSKLIYEFEVCVFCAEGEDAGKFYGCMEWSYEQEKGEGSDNGEASQPGTTAHEPSKKFKEALKKWSDNHGFNLPQAS